MSIKTFINWKLYFLLLAGNVFSTIAILPYVTSLEADVIKASPLPLPIVLLLSVVQSTVLFSVLLFIGLRLAKSTGFKVSILENYLAKKKIEVNVKQIVKTSIPLGVLAGVAIVGLDLIFIKSGSNLGGQVSIPIWQGFLASFYGGISEEILLRLFFMTFIVWLIGKLIRTKSIPTENNIIIWSSIIIAAIIFGLGHLPATAAITTLSPLVIFRAILLNGIGGVVFGWLYWKRGFESAMIAHFSADIVIHVIFPIALSMLAL